MRIFWKNTVENASASGAPHPNPRLPPAAPFSPIFRFKRSRFYDGGRKNISCPRALGTLATPLHVNRLRNNNKIKEFNNKIKLFIVE